jgi:hypothetical protein
MDRALHRAADCNPFAGAGQRLHKEQREMTSKMKTLALAVFAIAAMSMVGAATAQAGVGELHITKSGSANYDLTGEQVGEHAFTLPGIGPFGSDLVTNCKKANFEGTNTGTWDQVGNQTTSTEGTVTGLYTECRTTLGSATVKMNGCKYTLTGGAAALTANVDITGCTTGKKIEITSAGCLITVKEQGPLAHMTFTNEGSGDTQDVKVNITVSGIHWEIEKDPAGSGCLIAKQTGTNGQYKGNATFKAHEDTGKTELVTHEDHQYNKLICGAQKGLFAT